MNSTSSGTAHPILTCEQALALETHLFRGNEDLEWRAMMRAGAAVAEAVLRDFEEIGGFPKAGRILILAGKGHNAGDALLAGREILARHTGASLDVVFFFGERPLRPLAAKAWRLCLEEGRDRVSVHFPKRLPEGDSYALCLDGVFGFQFRPPLDPLVSGVLAWSSRQRVRLRAAVDLPSGLDAPGAFSADFTYATGSAKTPLLSCAHAGRLRYLDLGFFSGGTASLRETIRAGENFVLTPAVLDGLVGLRPARSDKRSFGHVFLLGGSRSFPGAILMATLAALRSGAGLVTAFVPETLAPSFAARAPEAMWVGCPETPEGGLALEGHGIVAQRLGRANSLVLGPGLGREPETLVLVETLAKESEVPLVFDADALQPSLVSVGCAPRILTPHAGEYLRISGGEEADCFSAHHKATVVLKGPVTRIAHEGANYHSFCGGPVLARGGSGDVLAGLIGGLLAQNTSDLLGAAARGVVWQGLAADALARKRGQVAVQSTDLLEHLSEVLRERAT